jgi:hypothetical protein
MKVGTLPSLLHCVLSLRRRKAYVQVEFGGSTLRVARQMLSPSQTRSKAPRPPNPSGPGLCHRSAFLPMRPVNSLQTGTLWSKGTHQPLRLHTSLVDISRMRQKTFPTRLLQIDKPHLVGSYLGRHLRTERVCSQARNYIPHVFLVFLAVACVVLLVLSHF